MVEEHMHDDIAESARRILGALPDGVELVAAAKGRTSDEVRAAVDGGVRLIGHNYLQEAQAMIPEFGGSVQWHMIGDLQRNKAKLATELFDVVETLDSVRIAEALDRRCATCGRRMPVLVEINSGRESSKHGVLPEDLEELVSAVAPLQHIAIVGLMTMGPRAADTAAARPYFTTTRRAFEKLASRGLPGVEMHYLSMGMSSTWQAAVDEGANIVRIGTELFGPRP
jgi:pyridoxal phosphate enzyme (YggS family)